MCDSQLDDAAGEDAFWDRLPLMSDGFDHKLGSNASCAVRSVEGLVLRVGSTKAEIWSLPVQVSQGPDGIVQDYVDVESFFPSGCLSVVICSTTGSYNPLPYAYRVYVDNHKTQRPLNRAVDSALKQLWVGNIVVVRYGRNKGDDRFTYASVQRGEDQLVLCILGEWLLRMWNGMFERTMNPLPV